MTNLGESIEQIIKQTVHDVLAKGDLPDSEYIETDNLGEVIEKLAIIHIRMWMLEDAIQAAKSDEEIADLKPDMILEGVVTNVAAFGAFVDIGVHQDGLVHISQLADKFVDDPKKVVKVGQVVKVQVLEINEKLKRISLSMKGIKQ